MFLLTANSPSAILKTRNDKKTCQNAIESCQKGSEFAPKKTSKNLRGGVRPSLRIEREAQDATKK